MADVTVEEAMERYGSSEVTCEDLLEIEDPHYALANVVIITGGGAGIGRTTALAFADRRDRRRDRP